VPLLPALAALVMLAAAGRAAPSAEEQRLYSEGLAAWNAGDARGAERAWAEGYRVARDPAFLVRMGEAEEKAGAPVEAYETYRRYLREAPDASDRADIEQRIARLAPAPAPAPRDTEQPGELGGAAAPTPVAPPPRAVATDAEPPAKPAEEGSGWNAYNVTAMSAAGVTVVLLGTAAFFGAQASSKESDVNRLLGARDEATGVPVEYSKVRTQYEAAMSDGRNDAHAARVVLVAAAGVAVVSAVFFVLDAHFSREANVALAPVPTAGAPGGLLAAAWRF
jgi:hypothetical protein